MARVPIKLFEVAIAKALPAGSLFRGVPVMLLICDEHKRNLNLISIFRIISEFRERLFGLY